MQKNKQKFSFSNWFLSNKLYLLAFILPVISMILTYVFKGCFPFGDNMYLRSDCYHQYTPYLQMLQEKLHNGGSLFYSWEIGAGMNFLAIAAYYLSSPLNLLVILWPGNMADIVSFFIILKMGLSGFSMCYYLTKKYDKKSISAVAFGMAYALSAYFAAFSWNIMWLDCMWLLPLIILGLESLFTKRKGKMYCISLALAIFSNYYIGIMLCIFSVIYFIYLFIITDVDADTEIARAKAKLLIFKDYVIYSVLAGGLAAVVILPEYFNLLTTKSADSAFPEAVEEYFSILYMIFRSLISIPVADLKYPHDPNIYCSMAVFILIPLFWFCKKISTKVKIGKTILAVIMLLSFSLNIPNYIWHGFHFPNSLPCRESFIYIFLILTMCYEAFMYIKEYKSSDIAKAAAGSIALLLLFEEIFDPTKLEIFTDVSISVDLFTIIYLSLIFIFLYAILILLYKSKPEMKGFMSYLMILVVFCELTLNMNFTGIQTTASRSGYYNKDSAYEQLNKMAKEDAQKDGMVFFRTEEASHETRNDGARFKYNSISTFSSVSSAAIQDYYDTIGMQTSYNAYSYYGHTPLTAALFNIKYEITGAEASLPNNMTLLGSASYDNNDTPSNINIYKYNQTLPLCFVINSSTMANWDTASGNPFITQNNFVTSAVSGGKTIFHQLEAGDVGTFYAKYNLDATDTYKVTGKESTFDVYFFTNTSSETLTATVSGTTSNTFTFSSTNQNYICHIGNVEKGSKITVTASDGQALTNCFAYAFDQSAWDENYTVLNSQPLVIDSYTDTKINGTVTANNTGMMYTSIPYDSGWSVYVDGNRIKPTKICDDALLGFMVTQGTHKIVMKYCPKGFVPGIIISILCIVALLGLIYYKEIFALINKNRKKK